MTTRLFDYLTTRLLDYLTTRLSDYSTTRLPDYIQGLPMKLERIDLFHIAMPLVSPFGTSFGMAYDREYLILKLYAEGWWAGANAWLRPRPATATKPPRPPGTS
ncbi:MAG: hypothetical protein M5U34_19940 [Chloroflexi bacterium]|nr:hypothetical protein [Chloroflexota bacterium]